MEPMASILDKLKAFAKSGEDFFAGLTRRESRARRNPVLLNFPLFAFN